MAVNFIQGLTPTDAVNTTDENDFTDGSTGTDGTFDGLGAYVIYDYGASAVVHTVAVDTGAEASQIDVYGANSYSAGDISGGVLLATFTPNGARQTSITGDSNSYRYFKFSVAAMVTVKELELLSTPQTSVGAAAVLSDLRRRGF